jgi:ribosomal protein S18 acetylase RimI-like enzyme
MTVERLEYQRWDDFPIARHCLIAHTIRPATPADASAIAALVDRAYERYIPRMGRKPRPMLADYDSLVADGVVTVFEAGGRVCGALVAWVDGDSFYVDTLAVDPELHRTGIGRALLDAADELGRLAGCRRLALYTNAAMTENLEYYPRRGFTELDRHVDEGYTRVFFERALLDSSAIEADAEVRDSLG